MGATPLHDAELVGAPARIPEGVYQATYVGHETAYTFRSPKAYVHFRIHGGEYDGTRLYRAYRVAALRGKPRRGGAIKLRHSHELYRQYVALSASRAERPDRLSLHRLRGCLLSVSVRTVTTDAHQHELPTVLRYSVVDAMLAIEVGAL